MPNNPNQPREYDAILGVQATPPANGVVLGGLEGVKQRLANPSLELYVLDFSRMSDRQALILVSNVRQSQSAE